MICLFGPPTDRRDHIARALGGDVLLTDKVNEIVHDANDITICVQARDIIPNPRPRHVFVLHDSLLPAFRGCATLAWQILEGREEFGVTLIEAADCVDAGPIIASAKISADKTPANNYDRIYDRLTPLYVDLVVQNADSLVLGTYKATPQDKTAASYGSRRTPADSVIDPSRMDQRTAVRTIRASSARFGFPALLAKLPQCGAFGGREIVGYKDDTATPLLHGHPATHRRTSDDGAVFIFADGVCRELYFAPATACTKVRP